MALPSTRIGSNACIPNLCNVGARFSSTGCPCITSSNTFETIGSFFCSNFFAALMLLTKP